MRLKSEALRFALIVVGAVALLYLSTASQGASNGAPAKPGASVLDREVIPRTPERLARGKYLVNGVLQCFYCHSEVDFSRRPAGPFPGKMGGGYIFPAEEMELPPGNRIVAPNISPDPQYGAGKWKDSDFVRALRRGIGHDGRTLFPLMPYQYFRHLSDEDLASVIVYIRSIPAVHIKRPNTELTDAMKKMFQPLPPLEQVAEPDKSDRIKYGEYLVAAGHCDGCHTPTDEHGQPIPGMYLAGGEPLTGYWGPDVKKLVTVSSLNLTPDPSGISFMDEALFIKAIRTGQVQARLLSNIMPWTFFRHLTDDDLKAMFAYLRTVKPVQHRVDNTEPPGYCKLCRHRHGYGKRN
jgi:mono/diheme cytochrome c family protein